MWFIIVGISVYVCFIDYVCMREVCDEVKVYLLVDMVYISGLVVVKVIFLFFKYVDIVIIIIYKIF